MIIGSSTTLQANNPIYPFRDQPLKTVKHTQTIRRLLPTNCLSVFDHFVGLALKGLSQCPPLFQPFPVLRSVFRT